MLEHFVVASIMAPLFKRSIFFELVTNISQRAASFFGCPICLGFWCGLVVHIATHGFKHSVPFALGVSFASFFADHLMEVVELATSEYRIRRSKYLAEAFKEETDDPN